jgi:hypothetical protein
MSAHQGLLEGVDNAHEIRDLILQRLQQTRTSGLGDERETAAPTRVSGWSPAHVAMLREIRELVRGGRC